MLYLFSTDAGGPPSPPLLHIRTSADGGTTWQTGGHIFEYMPEWALAMVPQALTVWAPDIAFFNNTWHLYYAVSSFGSPVSVIGLVTTPTLANAVWTDRGLVLQSNSSSNFNAIDPNIFEDSSDSFWLLFGSFWSGIKAIRIDQATGKVDHKNSTIVSLAQRASPDALEASFMVQRNGIHYLFVSWDFCCRGAASTYNVRVGRSTTGVQGPFYDRDGVGLMRGGGSLLIAGGFGWAAGGGQSLLRSSVQQDLSQSTMVLHAYDGVSGDPYLQVVNVTWGTDGWPAVLSP